MEVNKHRVNKEAYMCNRKVVPYSRKFSWVQIFAKVSFPSRRNFHVFYFRVLWDRYWPRPLADTCQLTWLMIKCLLDCLVSSSYRCRADRRRKMSRGGGQDVVCWFKIVIQCNCLAGQLHKRTCEHLWEFKSSCVEIFTFWAWVTKLVKIWTLWKFPLYGSRCNYGV